MPGPFTFPVAQAIPFEPNRNGSDIAAENVQDAIEEAKSDALNNDRFLSLCSYGGAASTGRYLEFFPGIDSSEAPIYLAAGAKLINIAAQTTATVATCTIGFFNMSVSTTVPVFTLTFTSAKRVIQTGSANAPLATFPAGCAIGVRVTSGSIAKPHMLFALSADT